MDARQLQFVVRLAETLHFRRAADSLHIAQSALSTQIARLEREIGARLFERSRQGVSLTVAGEAFLPRAQAILAELADAAGEARRIESGGEEDLVVGLYGSGAGELTPLIIEAYRRARPGARLAFEALSMADQIEAVAAERVDVAFIRPPVTDTRVRTTDLYAQPRAVALPSRHPLTEKDEVWTADVLDEMFPVPTAAAAWQSYWTLGEIRGAPPRPGAEVRTIAECLHSVAYAGGIATVVSAAARFHPVPGVSDRPLRDASFSSIAIASRRGRRSAAVDAFRQVAVHLARTSLHVVPDAVRTEGRPAAIPA